MSKPFFFGLVLALASLAGAKPINVIVVLTDDQATWTLGCYGGAAGVTPHLDELARSDTVRFTNAFAATPVCSPSRAGLLTGRYGTQLGITDWIAEEEGIAGLGLRPGMTTWPALLQQAGWRTGLFGKWHLGTQPQFHPTNFGYDHFFGFVGNGARPRNTLIDFPAGPRAIDGYLVDRMTDEVMAFIDASGDRPFALSLHYREPHEPYGPMPEEDVAAVAKIPLQLPLLSGLDAGEVETKTRAYLAAVHAVDRNMGRLIEHLSRKGLWDRTVFIFTSDHGYQIGQHLVEGKGNAWWMAGGVRGPRRPNLWDHSLRVPLLVRWPGVTRSGEAEVLTTNLDLFSTLLAMAGVAAPETARSEGVDLSPWLRPGMAPSAREQLFFQYDLHNTGSARLRAVRSREWKLVRRFDAARLDELYNLKDDPEEMRNLLPSSPMQPLAPQLKAVREKLERELLAWMRSIDDPILQSAR